MINLADFETVDTATMIVRDPDGDPMMFIDGNGVERPATITYHAPGSDAFIRAETKRTNRGLRRQRTGAKLNAEDLRADQIEFLVDVTASHEGLNDKPGVSDSDFIRSVYENRKIGFIPDQGTAFLNDWSHFKKGSATN